MKARKKRTNGIALIATILILALCFSSLLTVLSLTSLSLKRGGKTQYHSYQALLAAESGINSFTARSSDSLFDNSQDKLQLEGLNQWLVRNNLDKLSLLPDNNGNTSIENTLRFSNLTPQSATLESTGTVQNRLEGGEITTLAKKVLRVDFKLHAAGSQLRIQPHAALTTLGDLNLEGNVALKGAAAQESSGLIRGYDQARAHPTPLLNSKNVQLRIQHPNRFHTGQYIELQSGRYKVTTVDKNAGSLELLPLSATPTKTLTDDEITLIPLALNTDIGGTGAKNIELPVAVNQEQAFAIGQSISIDNYLGTIVSIDTDKLILSWTNSIPKQVIAEGSTISLGILGARASQNISSTTGISPSGGQEENANLSTNTLFEQTFGLSKNDLLGIENSYNQRSGKSFDLLTTSELQSITKLAGLYYTEDNLYFDSSHPLCGNAILISSANISVEQVCDDGFSGLLYTFGNYTQTSGHIEGAIISEENTLSGKTNLSGNTSIIYDANGLNNWHSYLQDAIANQDGKQTFQQVAGSWRLE